LHVAAALAAVVALAARPAIAAPAEVEAAADQGMAAAHVPALAVLEIRDGKIAGEAVRGVRVAGRPDRARPGDLWHLGSDGKAMTATLVARLVERGVLSWDAKLAELLPDLAPMMNPEVAQATLQDLVSHRSGLAENGDETFLLGFYDDHRPLPAQRLDYLKQALAAPPAVPRGRFNYSNTAFIAAAAIAERATGRSYEELMRREVFRPLGMRTAEFGPTPPGEPAGHEGGKPVTGPRGDNPAMFAPAGGMHMSLADWARFCLDQMAGEDGHGRLLRAETYRLLHTPRPSDGDGRRVAMDWGVRDETYGRLLTHSGSNGDWYAIVALAPDIHAGVLAAANAAEDAGGDKATARAFTVVSSAWAAAPAH
jgi:CubicO group peptidase (beta-lactamase class C family)